MAPKRSRDEPALSYTPSRGPKRRQLTGSLPPSSPIPSSSSVFTTPRTPAWKVPADSPTNPFGRIRRLTQGTTLPRPTSFSKHLPLRFQFIHARVDGREIDRDGIYRIVQVPLNYTLAHLRKLIQYIFVPATDAEIVESHSLRRSSRRMSSVPSSNKGKQIGLQDPVGHIFEIRRKIKMGAAGQIKTAQTWAKASTVRDPIHYPGNDSEDSLWLDDDGAGEEWKWEAEEDFTLAKVWPKGGDLARGIVYVSELAFQSRTARLTYASITMHKYRYMLRSIQRRSRDAKVSATCLLCSSPTLPFPCLIPRERFAWVLYKHCGGIESGHLRSI